MKNKLFLLSLFVAVGTIAQAGTLALDIVPNGGTTGTNGAWSLGWLFQVNSTITVTSVDFFDDYGNGLTESHDVGIWDLNQNLLVFGTVLPTDPLVGTAPWREHAVTPTILSPGLYYIAAETGTENYTYLPNSLVTIPQITFLQDRYIASTTLALPTTSIDTTGWFGPSFNVVPEPCSFSLLVAGLGIAGAIWRRRSLRS
jgi:hypothetical protein